jgi:hypothetical protein
MCQDRDKLILGWLNQQPARSAKADTFPIGTQEELSSLERRGFIVRIPTSTSGGMHGYVITPEGKHFQDGD